MMKPWALINYSSHLKCADITDIKKPDMKESNTQSHTITEAEYEGWRKLIEKLADTCKSSNNQPFRCVG